jgi:hypothetical protein
MLKQVLTVVPYRRAFLLRTPFYKISKISLALPSRSETRRGYKISLAQSAAPYPKGVRG